MITSSGVDDMIMYVVGVGSGGKTEQVLTNKARGTAMTRCVARGDCLFWMECSRTFWHTSGRSGRKVLWTRPRAAEARWRPPRPVQRPRQAHRHRQAPLRHRRRPSSLARSQHASPSRTHPARRLADLPAAATAAFVTGLHGIWTNRPQYTVATGLAAANSGLTAATFFCACLRLPVLARSDCFGVSRADLVSPCNQPSANSSCDPSYKIMSRRHPPSAART